jgi:MOB kinase activator 1
MNKLFEVASFTRKTRTQTTITHKPPNIQRTRQRSKNVKLIVPNNATLELSKQELTHLEDKIELDTLSVEVDELKNAVKLPIDEGIYKQTIIHLMLILILILVELNSWLAIHVVDFSRNVSLLSNVIVTSSSCTSNTCSTMSAGDRREYLWLDKNSEKYTQPQKVSAPQYLKLLFEWINYQIEHEFPKDETQSFPKQFSQIVKKMMSRLFRVFAHIYKSHYEELIGMGSVAHLNTLFMHFMLFCWEFNLVKKEEFVPLNQVILKLFGDQYKKKLQL